MSTGTLAPQLWLQVRTPAGAVVPGALVNFYASGLSTRLTAYSNAALTTPLSNPAVCDSAGILVYYLSPTSYKIIVTDTLGVQIGPTVDPLTAVNAGSSGLGSIFTFGSNSAAAITATTYASGATFDKLHPGTGVFYEDSANLTGTYVLQAMGVQDTGGTLTVALVDLSSGAPDTPIATVAITSLTGESGRSAAITFGAAGVGRYYGIKPKVSANTGFLINAEIIRTA